MTQAYPTMRHSEYTYFFWRLAEQHVAIRHSEHKCRFVRMHLSSDPLQRMLDSREFFDGLRSQLAEGFVLVLESYEADYSDNTGDQKKKEYHGAFYILHHVEPGDFKDRLHKLIGKSAYHIDIYTYHGFAFQLLGRAIPDACSVLVTFRMCG